MKLDDVRSFAWEVAAGTIRRAGNTAMAAGMAAWKVAQKAEYRHKQAEQRGRGGPQR